MDIETQVFADEFPRVYFAHDGVLKCSFTVEPFHVGLQGQFQMLRDLGDLDRKLMQLCWGIFGPAVSGQYTLGRKCHRVMAGKIEIYYRPAHQHEADDDFEKFSDQVVGDELTGDPKEQGHAVINFLGSRFMFRGPIRLEDLVCPLISYEGGMPTAVEVAKLVAELDREKGKEILPGCEKVFRCYFVIHSADGEMHLTPFAMAEEYDPQKAINIGEMDRVGDKLIFYPEGDRSAAVDYSEHLLPK